MADTKPIQDLLAAFGGPPAARPALCGGAIVPVSRDNWQAMQRNLDVDLDVPDLPPMGTVEARVVCGAPVLEAAGVTGRPVQYATCARCAAIESRLRSIRAAAGTRQ
jgi:hypothetical protein